MQQSPAAMPLPTATNVPTPTPRPITAPTPTAIANHASSDSHFEKFPEERVFTVEELKTTSSVWQDREPFLLIAYNTGAYVGSGGVVFSNDGAYSEERYLVVVYRGPRPKKAIKDCYSVPVVFDGTTRYCFVRTGYFMPRTAGVSQTCRGWEQTATPSFYKATGYSSQSISQEEWLSLQPEVGER